MNQVNPDRISEIHLGYARKLPYKAARLRALAALLRASKADATVLKSAVHEAHQLKGTASVYGFLGVSRWAEQVETQLSTTPETDWKLLSYALDSLLAAAKAQCECLLGTVCPGDTCVAEHSE